MTPHVMHKPIAYGACRQLRVQLTLALCTQMEILVGLILNVSGLEHLAKLILVMPTQMKQHVDKQMVVHGKITSVQLLVLP